MLLKFTSLGKEHRGLVLISKEHRGLVLVSRSTGDWYLSHGYQSLQRSGSKALCCDGGVNVV